MKKIKKNNGAGAFGIYLGILIALHVFFPPYYSPGLETPGIDPVQEFFIIFFASWVYRPDMIQNIVFVATLSCGLLFISYLCSKGTCLAITEGYFLIGTFFFLYFANKYATPFLMVNLSNLSFLLPLNAIILGIASVGWGFLIERKYNPTSIPAPDKWVTIETICPYCGAKFKSNPKYCAFCSKVLRNH